jgi:hypothetical protein
VPPQYWNAHFCPRNDPQRLAVRMAIHGDQRFLCELHQEEPCEIHLPEVTDDMSPAHCLPGDVVKDDQMRPAHAKGALSQGKGS